MRKGFHRKCTTHSVNIRFYRTVTKDISSPNQLLSNYVENELFLNLLNTPKTKVMFS